MSESTESRKANNGPDIQPAWTCPACTHLHSPPPLLSLNRTSSSGWVWGRNTTGMQLVWQCNHSAKLFIKITLAFVTQHTRRWLGGKDRRATVRVDDTAFWLRRITIPQTSWPSYKQDTHLHQQPKKHNAASTDLSTDAVCVCVSPVVSFKCPGSTLYGLPDKQHLRHHLLIVSARPSVGSLLWIHTRPDATWHRCHSFLVQLLSSNIISEWIKDG